MKHWKVAGLLTILLTILSLSLLLGCTQTTPVEESGQRLKLTGVKTEADGIDYLLFTSDDLNGNYGGELEYLGFSGVNIELDGVISPMEEAVRDGTITVEEIIAYAQADARDHHCWEKQETKNGLTMFQYGYNGFKLKVINDVFETPDGQQHLIRELSIREYTMDTNFGTYLVEGGGPGDYIDKEDWGLNFVITEASPDGLTIKCDQAGGQQFGELFIWSYMLYRTDSEWYYEPDRQDRINQPIKMGDTLTFRIEWTDHLEALSPGSYGIRLRVDDIYSAEDVPPLSRNYHDRQTYDLKFTIE